MRKKLDQTKKYSKYEYNEAPLIVVNISKQPKYSQQLKEKINVWKSIKAEP